MLATHPLTPSLAKRRGTEGLLHPLSLKKERGSGGELFDRINPNMQENYKFVSDY